MSLRIFGNVGWLFLFINFKDGEEEKRKTGEEKIKVGYYGAAGKGERCHFPHHWEYPPPSVSWDPSLNMASLHEYLKKEHVNYMHTEGDELPDDAIRELANSIGNVLGLSDDSAGLTSLLDTATRGRTPRFSFDKNMVGDLHAWCVDDLGNVCDYPDDQNQHGSHSTKTIVRRPWDAHVVSEALPYIEEHCKRDFFDACPKKSNEEWVHQIQSNTFPIRNCFARAKILRDSQPEKYALVVGSLGYKQCDGSIFWEFGWNKMKP